MVIPSIAEEWTSRRNDEIQRYRGIFEKDVPAWIYKLSKRDALDVVKEANEKRLPLPDNYDV